MITPYAFLQEMIIMYALKIQCAGKNTPIL